MEVFQSVDELYSLLLRAIQLVDVFQSVEELFFLLMKVSRSEVVLSEGLKRW